MRIAIVDDSRTGTARAAANAMGSQLEEHDASIDTEIGSPVERS